MRGGYPNPNPHRSGQARRRVRRRVLKNMDHNLFVLYACIVHYKRKKIVVFQKLESGESIYFERLVLKKTRWHGYVSISTKERKWTSYKASTLQKQKYTKHMLQKKKAEKGKKQKHVIYFHTDF